MTFKNSSHTLRQQQHSPQACCSSPYLATAAILGLPGCFSFLLLPYPVPTNTQAHLLHNILTSNEKGLKHRPLFGAPCTCIFLCLMGPGSPDVSCRHACRHAGCCNIPPATPPSTHPPIHPLVCGLPCWSAPPAVPGCLLAVAWASLPRQPMVCAERMKGDTDPVGIGPTTLKAAQLM